ncbi:MAG: SdrD B-like domain-containing protein, partial [Lewinella sp.]
GDDGDDDDSTPDNEEEDEDDQDEEVVPIEITEVFDLALRKTIGGFGTISQDGKIVFDVTIFNQGDVDAFNIEITDYLDPATTYVMSTNGAVTTIDGATANVIDNGDATFTIDRLNAGDEVSVEVIVQLTQAVQVVENWAEISSADNNTDPDDTPPTDIDSTPDNEQFNQDGETDDLVDDDVIDEDGMNGGDEDDHDVAVFDLLIADPSGYIYCADACGDQGEVVTGGTISVTPSDGVVILQDGSTGFYQWFTTGQEGVYTMTYSHPDGYEFTQTCLPQTGPFDPTGTEGTSIDQDTEALMDNQMWLGIGQDINGNMTNSECAENPYYLSFDVEFNDPFVHRNNLAVSCNRVEVIGCDEVNPGLSNVNVELYACDDLENAIGMTMTNEQGQYSLDVDEIGCYRVRFTSNTIDIPANEQVDENGWSDEIEIVWGVCEDDITICLTDKYDLALSKNLVSNGPFSAGGEVSYSITIDNEGTLDAANVEVTDRPETGLSFVSANVPVGVTDNNDGTFTVVSLPAGQSISLEVTYVIAENFTGTSLTNVAEITGDDGDDDDSDPDNEDPNEDDQDEVVIVLDEVCELPEGLSFVPIPGDCSGIMPNNNGRAVLTQVNNADRFAISSAGATTFDGAAYADATEITTLPQNVVEDVSNLGETFIVRIYNSSNGCFVDQTIEVPPATCPVDPLGYLYCEETGEIITGGTISVEPPVGGVAIITMDGSDGQYQFFTDGTPGKYTITYTPPAGYTLSTSLLPSGTLDPTNSPTDPLVIGSGSTDGLFVDDFSPAANPFYLMVDFELGDPEVFNNNIPLSGCNIFDYGDLPDSYTTTGPTAPHHEITEDLLLGTCVDSEEDGQPEDMAGMMQGGDDFTDGDNTAGTCSGTSDEDGLSFDFPMIPGNESCINITAVNETGEDAILQVWIDWDGSGTLEADEALAFTDNTIPDGGVTNTPYCFPVPADATFAEGAIYVRSRLSPDGGLEPDNQTGDAPLGEIEDYKKKLSKVGNLVWIDDNGNGIQDTEIGVNGVDVLLTWTNPNGDDITYTSTTANDGTTDGIYDFCGLIPGTYTVSVPTLPTGFIGTFVDQDADDVVDADETTGVVFTIDDPMGLIEGENGLGDPAGAVMGFPDMQHDLSFDFGIYEPAMIGDFVWIDNDGDDVQSDADEALPGITVTLMGTNGIGEAIMETLVTDDEGFYKFMGLAPGEYKVIFDPTTALGECGETLTAVTPNVGDDALDSDMDPVTFTSGFYTLASGDNEPTVDAGFVLPELNLACISSLNVTLNDDCNALLIPQMLLTGNVACLDLFDFDITVMDSDPSNGPVIDECGVFNYSVATRAGATIVGFEGCWGTVAAEDKTSPEADFVPADVTLLCVDFENDANNVSTLPTSISRCYLVDAETGNTIPGSMAPALRARLMAGGLTPLVPIFSDGCAQELEVCVSDAVVFGDDAACDDIILTRTFVATEISTCVSAAGEGNAPAVASYEITFERPTLADLDAESIEAVVTYEQCGTANPTRADYPAPRANDFPSLQVGDRILRLGVGDPVCNIGVTYSDGDAIITCPFTYKFVRTYTVIDWCDPSDVRTFTQVVKVGDTTAPVLTGPNVETNDAGDLVFGTNAGNICAAYLRLDDVSAVDNCSGTNVSISAEIFPGGDDTGAPIGAFTVVPGGTPELSSAIPAGRHLLRYTSTDECGNTSIDDFFFVVEDQTPPVAICEDGLNISIAGASGSGFAVLTPDHINNGSYDDCSDVSLSIARVNSSDLPIGLYGSQITLTCADIGTVRVGLRVEDALGNVNYCWLDVLVEDKLAPTCVAPANLTITCIEYNTNMPADIEDATTGQLDAVFGAAAGVDNCGTTITQSISGDVNNCGVGSFTRTFVSTDDAGFTNVTACTQRIDVVGIHDYRLTFPTDESGLCADIPEYDGIVAEELACDLITTTTDVDTLRTLDAGDECFKLRITYDVVNWCEYNSLGDPYIVTRDGNGVNNRQRQPRNIDEDVLYVNVIPNSIAGTNDDQAFMTLFTDRALNTNAPQRDQEFVGYASSDSRGFFRYTQFIKIYDEVAPEITFNELDECFAGSGEGCRTTVTIEFTALDECSTPVVDVELDANYIETAGFNADNAAALGIGIAVTDDGAGNYTVSATNVPVGEHALRVRASDGCGNFDVRIIEFCVTADRTPTPICIQTLTVVLMDDNNGGGTAAIWASDFIASPIEDCFGNEVTKYSLFRSSDAGAAGFTPTFNPPSTNGIDDIDCADFEAGTVNVRVYAFDDNGSTPDYCEVVVEVQDNMGWCDDGGSGNIAGLITDQDDVAVENVSVTLTGAMDMTTTTDATGQFSFNGLTLGADYTVQPALDAPVNLRNVKSSDLVAMIGQILGTTTFDSPYDFVAADVNRDRELNIFDVVNVSQVILGQVDLFDGGESWVFVEANATINVANPYATSFPEVYNANDLAGTVRADFVAVEMGNPFGLSSRSALNLTTDDAQLEAGQMHTIVLDGTELAAFQGTLELGAGLELIGAEYTGEGGMNLNRAGEGMIAIALRENATVSLEIRATTSVTLSEQLTLTDAITVREGVGANGVGNGLGLAFDTDLAPAAAQNVLHQNMPNPVRTMETTIRFELAAAAPATLTLRDAAGRLISVQDIDAAAGMNTVELTNIKASGVLTYTLTSGEFTASKKMVVLR